MYLLAGVHCKPFMLDPGAAMSAAMRCLGEAVLKRWFKALADESCSALGGIGAHNATC